MAFFNFNLADERMLEVQSDVLEQKFWKHRDNPDRLTAERKIRGYVLEALISFSAPTIRGAKNFVESHPAKKTLTNMLNWLKDHGYKTTIRPAEGVVITSPRNTYVAAQFNKVDDELPKSVNLMSLIASATWLKK